MGRKISEMTDEERRDYLDHCYLTACELHSDGDLEGPHPSRVVIGWSKAGKARAAATADANGNGPDSTEYRATNEMPANANTGVPRAEPRLSADSTPISPLEAALLTGMARDERRTANMAALGIPGYDRIK